LKPPTGAASRAPEGDVMFAITIAIGRHFRVTLTFFPIA